MTAQYPQGQQPIPAGQPGLYPLRPLSIGELMGAGLQVGWRYLPILAPVTVLLSALSVAINLAVIALRRDLQAYASGSWAQDMVRHPGAGFPHALGTILLGYGTTLLVGVMLNPAVIGYASTCAAEGASHRNGRYQAVFHRLRGRTGKLLLTSAAVGLVTAVGYVLLIVPGIIAQLTLIFAGPAVTLEDAIPRGAFRRSADLSRGSKGRILWVTVLVGLIGGVLGALFSAAFGRVLVTSGSVQALLITQGLAVLVGGLASVWIVGVMGVLYVDTRMRREDLHYALLAALPPEPGNH